LHLYLDTYVSELALFPNSKLDRYFQDVQSKSYTYRKQSRIDVVKYTLASYAELDWQDIWIRLDGDDKEKIFELGQFAKKCMPRANIFYDRSDTGKKYVDSIRPMLPGNPWIFFTPNNDHPFIHRDVNYLSHLKDSAEKAELLHGLPVSILYSHYTESVNSISPNRYLYGYTGEFCKVIFEDKFSYWVLHNEMPLLSTNIYRAEDLYSMMKMGGDNRIIRMECLGRFLTKKTKTIQIVPKEECCRHYDGYMHTAFVVKNYISASLVPPLFIPDGFFEGDIKIKYGFDSYFPGYINISPQKKSYIYDDDEGTDLGEIKSNIPAFWRKRISSFDVNPQFLDTWENNCFLARQIENPWKNFSKHTIFLVVIWRRFLYAAIKPVFGNSIMNLKFFINNRFLKPTKLFFKR